MEKPVGYFEPYTTGEFMNYPKNWLPVFVYDIDDLNDRLDNAIKECEEMESIFKVKGMDLSEYSSAAMKNAYLNVKKWIND